VVRRVDGVVQPQSEIPSHGPRCDTVTVIQYLCIHKACIRDCPAKPALQDLRRTWGMLGMAYALIKRSRVPRFSSQAIPTCLRRIKRLDSNKMGRVISREQNRHHDLKNSGPSPQLRSRPERISHPPMQQQQRSLNVSESNRSPTVRKESFSKTSRSGSCVRDMACLLQIHMKSCSLSGRKSRRLADVVL